MFFIYLDRQKCSNLSGNCSERRPGSGPRPLWGTHGSQFSSRARKYSIFGLKMGPRGIPKIDAKSKKTAFFASLFHSKIDPSLETPKTRVEAPPGVLREAREDRFWAILRKFRCHLVLQSCYVFRPVCSMLD